MKCHENNVNAAGLNVIKDIKADTNHSSQWLGEMYSAADNAYVAVRLILINPSTIAVFEIGDVLKSNERLRII